MIPTVETCEELFKSGFPQKTALCAHLTDLLAPEYEAEWSHLTQDCLFAAPVFTEIWDELPRHLTIDRKQCELKLSKKGIGYYHDTFEKIVKYDPNLAQAAARLWLEVKQYFK